MILKAFTILGLVVGLTAASVSGADARGRGAGVAVGVAAGIIGLGILGAYSSRPAYAYTDGGACYKGPERCGYSNRSCFENRYGETICRGGEWRCFRRTYCD